ncbi:proliferation marker protein Ki-67 isoform X2 [Narcine bancroftii]|uniref:proliferation marker protein Ki-67 isoform X2 n=1 Tax=Narcine bancroftii TaxID=1343680 RepID=UPI0038314B63
MSLYGKIIVIKRTGTDGYNYPLTSSSCLFGRKTECDVRIQLPHVSKEHCKLEVNENNEVILINLSEVNQTLLNGKVVRHSERLKHRDTFTVIDRSFRFEYPLDSVHNTSPRKKRNSSTSKTETLQVLHVQQELDDKSQSSIIDDSSTSGHKSDKDKDFRVPIKSPKVTPNGREDPALQNRQRSFTKLLDGKTAGPENASPFSKLYEMVKQQATKPTQRKPNQVDRSASDEESNTDLMKQISIPAKESNVKISQDDRNPPASESERMSRRICKIRHEEGMMAKDENEEMRELNPQIEDIANANFSISTGDINTLKNTEQPFSVAKIMSVIPLSNGGKGKEQINDKTSKSTPKAKSKSQFIKCKSLTLDATPKKFEEILEPSREKRKSVVVHNTTFESPRTPGNVEKKKDEIPKMFVGESLQCKNENGADIESEKPESTNFSEPSVTKFGKENNLVGTPVGKDDEKFDTPKSRGRPSLGKNGDGTGIESEQVESTYTLKSSAANSGIANDSVNKGFTPVKTSEKVVTLKRRSRSSLRNNKVDGTNIDSEMGEPIKFSELSTAKFGMENNLLGMECTSVRKIGEKFDTPKRRSRSSLPKSIEGVCIESEQVQFTNFLKSSNAKLGMDSNTVKMNLVPVKIGEEQVDTPKRRGRSSLCKKSEDGAESTNALKSSVANSGMPNNTGNNGLALVKIDDTKVHTPKSRRSLHNKNIGSAGGDLEQDESISVMESSAEKLMKKNNSISTGHLADNIDEEKFRSAKTRGRPSLCNKQVEAADTHSEPTEFTNVSERSAAKLWGEIKSIGIGCTQVKMDEGKPGTSKRRSRSLCLKNVDIQEGKAASAEVLASPITAKSELEDKLLEMQHAGTLRSQGRLSPCEVPSMSESPVQRGGSSPSSLFQHVKKRESNVVEENLKGKNLTSRSPQQDLTNKQTEEKVPRLSKKRTSENENLVRKRKRVSFGVNLSPEVYDKHMPPCSPLRKGGTPTRVSTPFRLAPCAVSKRKSSIGINTCTIQECSEQSKSSIISNVPSANASGSFSQKRLPSSSTKKSPLSKTLSTFSSSTKSNLITAGSFGSPHLSGSFSNSHIATPPNLTQSVKSCITPKSLSLAQMDESQQKPSSGKKASRKSTRRSSVLAQIQSRRQSGASFVNLLVKKSWAQVVKEGVARPQLRNVAKRPVKQKRLKNVVSLKVTPARLVKDHFSTGHATSPATIVIGKSQTTKAKPTRQTPWQTRTISLRKKDHAMDESFTGMAEMFSTPMNINERENPVIQSLTIDDAEGALAIPISQKTLENSASKTPEETGVKAIAPLNILNRSSGGRKTVLRLLKCRVDLYCSNSNRYCESPAEITEKCSEAEGTGDLQRIKKTPRVKGQPVEDMVGVKRIMKTSKKKGHPVKDMIEVKRIMKTPRVKGQPVEDLVGVKRIMKTPRVKGQPVEDLVGVKRIMKTPRVKGQPVEDMVGVKRIMKTPRVKGQQVEDLVGVKRIMKTPRVKGQPVEDMVGVKRIMKTPRVKGQPVEDLVGVKRIMKTPRVKGQPDENFAGLSKLFVEPKQKTESLEINYIGIKNLFSSKKEVENCDYSGLNKMFSTPVKIERISDSKLQLGSKSTSKSSALPRGAQKTEISENNLIQTGQKHNGASMKETSPSGIDCNSTLTLRAQGIRTRGVQAKCISSPPSQEYVQQSHQAETSRMSPSDDFADIPQIGITEYKNGWSLSSSQVSPARKSLKEKKIEDTEESIKNIQGMNGCTDEGIKDVSKMSSTKELLKEEKILDEVKIFMPNKSTPDKKQSDCIQTGKVIVFNSQEIRSLKGNDEIPNILSVEVEGPDSTTKCTVISRNESSNKIKEENNIVSTMTESLRGRKNVKDHGAKVKEMTRAESQDGKIYEAKIIASPETKTLKGKEIQDVKVASPPTSAKICTQREGQISTSANEELIPLPLRKRQQSKTKSNKSKITEIEEETASIAKSSQRKKGPQCAQIEELVNSSLEKLSRNQNEPALPKISTKCNEIKDLADVDVKASVATGRPRRRKNITVEKVEMKERTPKKTNSRKKTVCPTPVEVVKDSNSLQSISRDQEEGSNTILNSGREGSEREKSESVKASEKTDTANSKCRSRRKRITGELISEDFKPESSPVKRLRNEEKLDETLTKETVYGVSNLTFSKVPDNAEQVTQRGSNRREVSKRSCRKKDASEQTSVELVETSGKHPNRKITNGVNKFHASDDQPEGTTKQKTGSSCDQQLIKEKNESKEPTKSSLNPSPLPPVKRLQRTVGQKIIQNGKTVKESSCTRMLRRNTMEQKLEVTTDDGLCVPVKMDSHKVKTAMLIETMPSSRIMEKGKKAKTSMTENKEQTHQQLSLAIVDIRNENKLPNQKINGKGCQGVKASSKGMSACPSNVENVSEREWKPHLNVSANSSEGVNNSDKIEAIRQTRSSSKGKVSKIVINDTKKMDVILSPVYEENAQPKKNVRKGKSEEVTVEGSKEVPLIENPKTELENRNLSEVAIDKRGKRKVVKEDVPAIVKEGLQINKEVGESVDTSRMTKRSMLAVINQELTLGITESKQLESSGKVEKRARKGHNSIKETAILPEAQGGKGRVINKRGRIHQEQIDNDENLPHQQGKAEKNGREQETVISMVSSQVSKRVTRAKKSGEATEMEQELQPLASGLLTQVSVHPSKRNLRGKHTVVETAPEVPAKKAKKEKVIEKETRQCSKTVKAAANVKKGLSIVPPTAKSKGPTTRSRK